MRWLLRTLAGVVVLVGLVLAIAATAVGWLGRGHFFPDKITEQLALYLAGDLRVEKGTLSITDRKLTAVGIELRATPEDEPRLVVPKLVIDLGLPAAGGTLPQRLELWRPSLMIVERPDGTMSPLDLVKPPPNTLIVPVVAAKEGSVSLSGTGPFSSRLDQLLSPEFPRALDDVELTTFPVAAPATEKFRFVGSFGLHRLGRVKFRGGVGRDFSVELEVTLDGVSLGADGLLGALHPDLRRTVEPFITGGKADCLVRWAMPGRDATIRPRFDVELVVRDLQVQVPELSTPLTLKRAELRFDGDRVELRRCRFDALGEELMVQGSYSARGSTDAGDATEAGDYHVTIRGEGLHFDRGVTTRVVHSSIRETLAEYDPRGEYDVQIDVTSPRPDVTSPTVQWWVRPRGASASYVGATRPDGRGSGFPYRVHDLVGELAGVPGRIELRSLRGRHAGGNEVRIDGAIEFFGDDSALDLTIRADQLPIDNEAIGGLEHAVPGSVEVVEEFGKLGESLGGTVDAEIRVWTTRAGESHHSVDLGFVKARCQPVWFPYPLEITGGGLRVEDGEFAIRALLARQGETRLTVDGVVTPDSSRVEWSERKTPAIRLLIDAQGLRLEERRFRDALAVLIDRRADDATEADGVDGAEAIARWLPPRGRVSSVINLSAALGEPIRFQAECRGSDVDFLLDVFPMPIRDTVCRVSIDNKTEEGGLRLRIEDAKGFMDGEVVSGSARIEEGVVSDLRAAGRGIPLSSSLLAATNHLLADQPVAREWVDRLRPAGKVTFSVDQSNLESLEGGSVDLFLDGVALQHPRALGGEVVGLMGGVRIDPARGFVELEGVSGRFPDDRGALKSSNLVIDFSREGNPGLEGDIEFVGLPFSDELAVSITDAGLREFFEQSRAEGTFDLSLPRLIVDLPRSGLADDAESGVRYYDATVTLHDCSIRSPLDVESIDGVLVLTGTTPPEGGEVEQRGELRDVSLRLNRIKAPMEGAARTGLDITGLSAKVSVDDEAFNLAQIGGMVAGGVLPDNENSVRIAFDPTLGYSGSFALDHANLRRVVAWFTEAKVGVEGELRLEFDFRGGGDLARLSGRGIAQVKNGRLWALPVVAEIYKYTLGAALGLDAQPVFRDGEIQFAIEEGRVELDRFVLDAPVGPTPVGLKLEGDGVVDFQGNVRMRVDPTIISTRIPIISPVIDAIKRRIVSYSVTGTLNNPKVGYVNPVGSVIDLFANEDEALRHPRLPPRVSNDWSKRF